MKRIVESAVLAAGLAPAGGAGPRRCDVRTNDRYGPASTRAGLGPRADEYANLPETVSREPLGPLVREDDWRWFDLVKWAGQALVAAEEFGATAASAEARRADPGPEVRRSLGGTGEFGQALGMERGPNRLWRDGGLLYAPPSR